jgi:hypothetical protein
MYSLKQEKAMLAEYSLYIIAGTIVLGIATVIARIISYFWGDN